MSSPTPPPYRMLLICGSLRRQSLNGLLLDCVPALAPKTLSFCRDAALGRLPLYNEDLDTDAPPAEVAQLRATLRACDGIVIASPEYNHAVSAPLKNAIDWASRPYRASALAGKVVVVLAATPGTGLGFEGLAQAQALLHAQGCFVVPGPRMVLHRAGDKLRRNEAGEAELSCPVARALVAAQMGAAAEALAAGAGLLAQRGSALFAATPSLAP